MASPLLTDRHPNRPIDERFRAIFGLAAVFDYEQAVAVIHLDDRDRVLATVAAATRPGARR